MSNSDTRPDVLDLLKAILLPGSDIVGDFASRVRGEAEETEWSELLNRIEGLALLLTAFALTPLIATLIFTNGWLSNLVKVIGLPAMVMLGVAIPLLYTYGVIYVFRQVDAGESVLMNLGDFDQRESKKVKVTLGTIFLSASLLMLLSLNSDLVGTVLVVMISLVIVGPLIVGLTCWLRVPISG